MVMVLIICSPDWLKSSLVTIFLQSCNWTSKHYQYIPLKHWLRWMMHFKPFMTTVISSFLSASVLISISQSSTTSVTILNSSSSSELLTTSIPSILNAFISTWQKKHMNQWTSKTSSHRWLFGLVVRSRWCSTRSISTIAWKLPRTPLFTSKSLSLH